MTPEKHVRANEIKATLQEIRGRLEMAKHFEIEPLISQEKNEVLRQHVIHWLLERKAALEKEYEEL